MSTWQLLEVFDAVDGKYVLQAKEKTVSRNRSLSFRKIAVLAAAVIMALAVCGFAAYELGFFDPWIQQPSVVPTDVVVSAIEGQLKKDYTVTVRVDDVSVDEDETNRMVERYVGSDLANIRGWTDEYLKNHFIAVRAKYYVEYDHTKTFLPDGDMDQYFYLVEDADTGMWSVIDNSTDGQPDAAPQD